MREKEESKMNPKVWSQCHQSIVNLYCDVEQWDQQRGDGEGTEIDHLNLDMLC